MANPKEQPDATTQNEGEGNKTAARHYNEATRRYVESGKVEKAARAAREALDSPEGEELKRADEEGRSHATDIEREADEKGDHEPNDS